MVGFCLLTVSLGMQERGRGDYKRHQSRPSLRKRRLVLRLPRGTSRYLGLPIIPIDYSSTTTIPKLNFRFLERTVTMQETCARTGAAKGTVGGRTRMEDEVSKGRPVNTPIEPSAETSSGFRTLDIRTDRLLSLWLRGAGVPDGALKA